MSRKSSQRRLQSRGKPALPSSTPQQTGLGKRDPATMGFDLPDWLDASSVPAPLSGPASFLAGDGGLPEVDPLSADEGCTDTDSQSRTVMEGMKVVCICKGIRKRVFWRALDEGMRTKEDINRCTGSGSGGCQGRRCGPRIVAMLRHLSTSGGNQT